MENSKFNIYQSLGFYFNTIFVDMKRSMEEKLKAYDLTHLQFSILINLYKNDVTTQKEILRYTNGDEASITRLIDRLEAKGLLNRVPSSTDKRKKHLVLTIEGEKLIDEAISCAKEVNKELTKDLEKDEARVLLKLLKKVYSSFHES